MRVKSSCRYSNGIVTALLESLDRRFGHILTDPSYRISAVLDPSFKLKWCESHEIREETTATIYQEMGKEFEPSQPLEIIEKEDSSTKPSKRRRLFEFMEIENECQQVHVGQDEFKQYLEDEDGIKFKNTLLFWKNKQSKYRVQAKIARNFLGVPATSAPVERVFSQAGRILQADRSKLLPENFEKLIFLQVNNAYDFESIGH